jgi:hypothetical protein
MALLFVSVKGNAADFLLDFDGTFSGTPPAGSSPWTTMSFHDIAPGTISLTISNVGLTGTEFISELDFNLNTSLNPISLQFTNVGGSGGFTLPVITTGVNFEKADGDGFFDIEFTFGSTAGTRFTADDYVTYQIGGIAGLTVADFAFLSAPANGGGVGPYYAAAHIQSTSGGNSGWVAPSGVTVVPEPTSGSLLAAAAALSFLFRRTLPKR